METLKLVSMQGGDADESYAQNSEPQNYSFHAFGKTHLENAVHLYKKNNGTWNTDKHSRDIIELDRPRLIRIADYGCCYGKNTLDYAQFIVTKILEIDGDDNQLKQERTEPQPELGYEFQYFFVDLPSNDFNSLFHMLHSSDLAIFFRRLKFYTAGVPGSFYDRVLPKGSVDFGVTTYSLHWLSQVPSVLLDKNSPAWNGGHVWIPTDGGGAVSEAYSKQFHEDARKFLRYRAEELRSNGVLFILSLCRAYETTPADYAPRFDSWSGYFEQTWNELVEEGIICASERDEFNVPQYNFSKGEFMEALLSVVELELLELHVLENCDCLPKQKMNDLLSDHSSFGEFWTSFLRSLIQPLVDAHIGKARGSQFFDRLQVIATKNAHLTKNLGSDLLIAVIRRK